MKHRLLVMNGQRIVQVEQAGAWANAKVDKAGEIKPGIYNIYLAAPADKAQSYSGAILHADADRVFQQIGKAFVMHDRSAFEKLPDVGTLKTIAYDEAGRATLTDVSIQQTRSRSR
jgi:hypothetical protein